MSRYYRRLTDGRRCVLVSFDQADKARGRDAVYLLRWTDTDETFTMPGRAVLQLLEHVEEPVKVEVGR